MNALLNELDTYTKKSLKKYNPKNMVWNHEEGILLTGSEALHKTTAKELYSHFVLRFLDDKVDSYGSAKGYNEEKLNIDNIVPGIVLFHSFEESKKLKYIKVMENIYKNIEERIESVSVEKFWKEKAYLTIPFYIKYDTEFGGKKNYNKALKLLRSRKDNLKEKERELYLTALIETLDNMSEEAFLEYRGIQRLLKEMAAIAVEQGDKNLALAYTLMKGARQYHLKYEYKKLGYSIFADIFEKISGKNDQSSKELGYIMLCQNELILMNR